jgi:hypothetical protein
MTRHQHLLSALQALQVTETPGILTNPTEITLLEIPKGNFTKNSTVINLPAFEMSATPITQKQWEIVANWPEVNQSLNPRPSYFKLRDDHPVETVSWDEAMEFCARLSQVTGRLYTLPTETQWEYACRAETTTEFNCGNTLTSTQANFDDSDPFAVDKKGVFLKRTSSVYQFNPNSWGLHDMHGNVWEWCLDNWSKKQTAKVLRGGSWNFNSEDCTSSYRDSEEPSSVANDIGFRVVCLPSTFTKSDSEVVLKDLLSKLQNLQEQVEQCLEVAPVTAKSCGCLGQLF